MGNAGTADDRIEAFVSLLEELLVASMDYSWGDDASVERLRETRRRVDAAWAELDAQLAGDPRQEDLRQATADSRARIGDNLFRDKGDADQAIVDYEAALALDPRCAEALRGIVAAYLQGSQRRPAEALPYAERLAEIEPSRARDLGYIRSLVDGRHEPAR